MIKNRKKALATSIALMLLLSMAVSLVAQNTSAITPDTKTTYAFVGASPNPVGVGQSITIALGITDAKQTAKEGWDGLTVTITRPDGTSETLGPMRTDSTGSTGKSYTPTMVGNYTLQSHFPAQWYNFSGIHNLFGYPIAFNTYYKASDSDNYTLTVQNEPVATYPALSLPTEYWTRPISSQLRSWYSISGNWLVANGGASGTGLYAPYNDGPQSAHILWTTAMTEGGLAGGSTGLTTAENGPAPGYGIGDAYEGKWGSRFILDGKLIYTINTAVKPVVYHAVDLHTGKELWAKTFLNNLTIAFGQELYWQTYNYQGVFSYLWVTSGTTWSAFDTYTGDLAFAITNVPSGTRITDDNGAIYILRTDMTRGWMALWNMSALSQIPQTGTSLGVTTESNWGNAVLGKTYDANLAINQAAYTLNVTIPTGLPGAAAATWFGDRVVGTTLGTRGFTAPAATATNTVWAISLKQGQEGQLLYKETWNSPSDWLSGNQTISWVASSQADHIGILYSKEARQYYGINLDTGKLAWGPTASTSYLDSFNAWSNGQTMVAPGKLYSGSIGGVAYGYNITTGNLLWQYAAHDSYTESLMSSNWWIQPLFATDDLVYFGSLEHSPNQPLPRGSPFFCINATDGTLVWRANDLFRQTLWGGQAIIGDSIIATMDTYDLNLYAIGKGPSKMTVTAPDSAVTIGTSIVIKGTVMDNSPGTKSDALTLRFPNGIPAVSDASMSDYMLYTYHQFPQPTNTTGIPVVLNVVDANGNYRTIGSTTSNSDGFFTFNWKPDIEGSYTVYASFAGSNSYWPSHAVTSFVVDPQQSTSTPQATQAPTAADLYFLPMSIAIIVAIIVIGAILALLLLRKHP